VAATGYTAVFEDDFSTDLGWSVGGTAADGMWERGTIIWGNRGDPEFDYDGNNTCYLTDNGNLMDNNTDVDDGFTSLISPVFDLSGGDATIHYARWFSNNAGSNPFTDEMNILISNNGGALWTELETIGPSGYEAEGGWYESNFIASEVIELTDNMKIRIMVSDDTEFGSVVEGAIDDFKIIRYECASNPPVITSETVPDWTVNQPYSYQMEVGGGVGALTWSDKYGDLGGTGLTMSSSGLISGTVTSTGPISFTAHVADETPDEDENYYTFNINEPVDITTTAMPEWTVDQPYSAEMQTTGGTGTKSWSDLYGDLSGSGLSVDASGLVTGTATAAATYSFTARATDQSGATDDQPLDITINPAVAVGSSTLPDARDGKSYSFQLEASGGTAPFTWKDLYNELFGTGLSVSETGLLSGTPSVGVTTISFTARVRDLSGSTGLASLELNILEPYICGDIDEDEFVGGILDIVYLINFRYKDGPPPPIMESSDVNNDGKFGDILDIVYLINFRYKEGPEPDCG
jgi:hypothetical protein